MKIPLLDLTAQYQTIRDEIRPLFDEICEQQAFIMGPHVAALEKELAAYSRVRHAIGCSSGTDALVLALMAAGIGPGDQVITSPFTFFATAGSIARVGATPVFVDVLPDTFNIDPKRIEAAITSHTKAIMPVDLFGQMAEMQAICDLARRRNLLVIEDAAQSIGAEHRGKRCGQYGQMTTLSFYPTKNLGAFGDGGMILTDDDALAHQCRILRVHGAEPKYYHKFIGGNFRLDALQAAALRVKLKHLDKWSDARRKHAARYNQRFAGTRVITPVVYPHNVSIYNQYTIRLTDGTRDAVQKCLTESGIGSEVYYPVPLHRQECFAYLAHRERDFPESEKASREVLSLPVYPELTDAQIDHVAEAVLKAVG